MFIATVSVDRAITTIDIRVNTFINILTEILVTCIAILTFVYFSPQIATLFMIIKLLYVDKCLVLDSLFTSLTGSRSTFGNKI